jgi:hypothetical protein
MFLAVWAVIETVAVAGGGSFNMARRWLPVAVLAGMAGAVVEYGWAQGFPAAAGQVVRTALPPGREVAVAVTAVAMLWACLVAGPWLMVAWGAALLTVAAWVMVPRSPDAAVLHTVEPHSGRDLVLLALAIAVAVTVTLFSNRMDSDDQNYLGLITRLLQAPDTPISSQTLMHIYRWHPYEALLAALVRLGAPLLPAYYLWLPAIHAILAVLVLYLCARPLVGGDAALTAVVAVVMLVAWGEIHRAPGNFAFVRLFQGKAALVTWALPLTFLAGMRLARRPSPWAAAVLAAALAASFSLGHTALTVAPLAALLGGLAGWPRPFGRWEIAVALGGTALLFGGVLAAEAMAGGYLKPRPMGAAQALALVFPPGSRSFWALAAPLAAGLVLAGDGAVMVRRMALLGLLFAFNAPAMAFLGRMAQSMSWRVMWGFPFPLMAAIAIVAIGRWERGRYRAPILAVALFGAFLAGGPWTVSDAAGNHFGSLDAKMSPEFSPPLDWVLGRLGDDRQAVLRWLNGGAADQGGPR